MCPTDSSVSLTCKTDRGPASVLVLTPWFPNHPDDRIAAYVYESAAAMARCGIAVHVLVCRPWVPRGLSSRAPEWMRGEVDTAAFKALASVNVVRYPGFPGGWFRSLTNWLADRSIQPHLAASVRNTGAQLVHAHTEGMAPVAAWLGAQLNVPTAVTLHGLNTDARFLRAASQRRRFQQGLSNVSRVILVGEPLRPFFRELAGRDDHFRVVQNGVRLPEARERKTPLLADNATVRFISVSYLHEGKGIDVALEALRHAREQGLSNWSFTVVGDGYERDRLTRLSQSLGLGRQVTFTGALPREKVYDLLADADVFVLPSYREAFGIAYLEAMASGLVTIGVRGEGPSAFIKSGNNGFLVEPRDSQNLAERLLYVASHRGEMKTIGAAAAATVRQGFTWESHAGHLLNVYREMLTEAASRQVTASLNS